MVSRALFALQTEELRVRFSGESSRTLTSFTSLLLDIADESAVQRTAFYRGAQAVFSDSGDRLDVDFGALIESVLHSAEEILADASQDEVPVEPRRIEHSARWCRGVLANALLLNIAADPAETRKDGYAGSGRGGLRWRRMFLETSRRCSVGKAACILQYFRSTVHYVDQADAKADLAGEGARLVRWEMVEAPDLFAAAGARWEDLQAFADIVVQDGVSAGAAGATADSNSAALPLLHIHDGPMELPDAAAFVNFANPVFGYGEFMSSCTQEEIMQVCCPEFNVGMLWYGHMPENAVVLTHNVRRFSRYQGFQEEFLYCGAMARDDPATAYRDQTIVAMDAKMVQHFTETSNMRDQLKAVLGFRAASAEPSGFVSTGKWGCGAFGGEPRHKFLQQVVAAGVAGRRLSYSCYGDAEFCRELQKLWEVIRETARTEGLSPKELYFGCVFGLTRGQFRSQADMLDRIRGLPRQFAGERATSQTAPE